MQVAFYLAGDIPQVLDAIPCVRCASGNVFILVPGHKSDGKAVSHKIATKYSALTLLSINIQ